MKKMMALLLVFMALIPTRAFAFDILGGLTTIFSSDEEISFGIGEKGTVDGVSATLVKVSESKGSKAYKPEDGAVYLICEFKVENETADDVFLSTLICFATTCDEASYQISIEAMAISALAGVFQLDQVVEAGKKVTGVIGYEVPVGWKNLKVRFTPQGWGGDSISFEAKR